MNLENVNKIFNQNEENEIHVLKNINISFEKGKLYAIMGRSGAGKTTLINILGLLDNLTTGKYTLDNIDVSELSNARKAEIRNKEIGFVFQSHYLDENLTVLENVILPTIINKEISSKERKERGITLLTKLGLSNRINYYPNKLSGGEKGRVSIARALINNPTYIIADEPTGNLDSKNEDYIFELLKKISKDKCIIVVTHNDKIKKYADKVYYINDGVISYE